MNKTKKVEKLLETEYSHILKKAKDFILEYEAKNKGKEIVWTKIFSKYMQTTLGLVSSSEEILTGKFKNKKDQLKSGDEYNLNSIKIFQELIIDLRMRYVMMNRRVHAKVNPWLEMKESDETQLAESIVTSGTEKIFEKGYIPPYLKIIKGKAFINNEKSF